MNLRNSISIVNLSKIWLCRTSASLQLELARSTSSNTSSTTINMVLGINLVFKIVKSFTKLSSYNDKTTVKPPSGNTLLPTRGDLAGCCVSSPRMRALFLT